jgi:hypothetical protein
VIEAEVVEVDAPGFAEEEEPGEPERAGVDGPEIPPSREEQAKAAWKKLWGAAHAAGYKGQQKELLAAMGHSGLLQVLEAVERDGLDAVVNAALDVVFPWPDGVVKTALIKMPYYTHRNHVINALNGSGLSKQRPDEELLDWLSSHARERQAEKEAAAKAKQDAQDAGEDESWLEEDGDVAEGEVVGE